MITRTTKECTRERTINVPRSRWRRGACVVMAACVGLVAAVPGYAQVAVTSDTLIERAAALGETYRETITLHNESDDVQVVSLKLSDYRFDAAGSNWFDEPGSQPRSNSGWIGLDQQAVSLLPHAEAAIGYTVTVPATAPAAGTYWSVVLVEIVRPVEALSDPASFGIATNIRYAVQIATHIGDTGEPTLAFGTPHLSRRALGVEFTPDGLPDEGQTADEEVLAPEYTLALDITHDGTRACRPALRLEVYRADGTLVYSATAQRGLLYPGTSVRQVFDLATLSPDDYTFLLLADVGSDKVQGTRFTAHVQ
jgi:hypothetical protein